MARPMKVKVDYFPHVTHTGKTIAILEARWGNDGYAFWFKLLELLGDSNDFSFNCNQPADWEYLLSRARVTEAAATSILDKLAEIDAIDAQLWAEKIIWSDHFVQNLEPVFERRKCAAPHKPGLCMQKPHRNEAAESLCCINSGEKDEIPTETDKVKESKVEESKGEQREGKEPEEDEKEEEQNKEEKASCPSSVREGTERQADTVYLKPIELARLRAEYGDDGTARIIALLDAYKTNHPKRCREYQDDYKVISAWVAGRYREERARAPGTGSRPPTFLDKLAEMAQEERS